MPTRVSFPQRSDHRAALREYQTHRTKQSESKDTEVPDLAEAEPEQAYLSQHVGSITRQHVTNVMTRVNARMKPGTSRIFGKSFALFRRHAQVVVFVQPVTRHELGIPIAE